MAFPTQRRFWPLFFISFCMTMSDTRSELESRDRYCLRSIKASLEDPRDIFSSWDFDYNTETGSICQFFGVTCWNDNEDRVMSLELHNWGLEGHFPADGVQNCTSLVWLNLSSNHFSGPIPSDISKKLPFLSKLDLSHNNFSGEIPPSISGCIFLNTLVLSNNRLTGQIPEELGQLHRMREFSVANNLLSGPVPVFGKNVNVHRRSYENNSGLCGGPLLRFCRENNGGSDGAILFVGDDGDEAFREGFIVGYCFSGTYVVVVCMFCCVPWGKLKQKRKEKRVSGCFSFMKGRWSKKNKQMEEWVSLDQLLLKGSKEMATILERLISRMSFAELCRATDNFSVRNTIGMGKIGMMYKASLPNGWFLAVKRLNNFDSFKRQFVSEIMILGTYRHRNMVPLLGFCMESKERFLVYQFMSSGKLHDWLHLYPLMEGETRKELEWPVTIKIALGIARGLSWLHHNSSNLSIIHCSISTECILLDQNFEPKISNFGEAKFMDQDIDELGLMKKDVYDFGIVLFELITGKIGGPFDANIEIDESLIGKGFEDEISTLLRFACDSVQTFPDQIPTMLEIYNEMCNIWDRYGCNSHETSFFTSLK